MHVALVEEVAPDVVTYGAAGFFGIVMYWQGVDDAARTALCPVVVEPTHLVRERPAAGSEAVFGEHARRREKRLRWRERLYQSTRRSPFAGPLLTSLAGLPALATLSAASLAPGWCGETLQRGRRTHDHEHHVQHPDAGGRVMAFPSRSSEMAVS